MNATQTRKTRKPAAKVERRVTLLPGAVSGGRLLRIGTRQEGKEWEDTYYLLLRAGQNTWKLTKIDGTSYSVFVGKDETYSNCNCPGHNGHRHCKHVPALLALRNSGKLEPKPIPAAELADF